MMWCGCYFNLSGNDLCSLKTDDEGKENELHLMIAAF